ncbi:MAG: hypothetical protein R3C32_08915 [Chloroflexota bacterium]
MNLQRETGTAIVLHHPRPGAVAEMCDRVAVMYAGRSWSRRDVASLCSPPLHPYTQGLIGAAPVPGVVQEEPAVIPGSVPNLISLPVGCRFAPRCAARIEHNNVLATELHPELRDTADGHQVRCWLYHHADGSLSGPRHLAGGRPARRARPAVGARGACGAGSRPMTTGPRAERRRGADRRHDALDRPAHDAARGAARPHQVVPGQGWRAPAHGRPGQGRRRGRPRHPSGRDAGPRGRVGCKTTVGGCCSGSSMRPQGDRVRRPGHHTPDGGGLRPYRRRMRIIFQDPYASLDLRSPIGDSIGEGLRIHGIGTCGATRQGGEDDGSGVGPAVPRPSLCAREFSGGQRQRIGIARALVLEPGAQRTARPGPRRVHPGPGAQPACYCSSASWASPICSSPTTWVWWSTSATGSR